MLMLLGDSTNDQSVHLRHEQYGTVWKTQMGMQTTTRELAH